MADTNGMAGYGIAGISKRKIHLLYREFPSSVLL